MTTITENPQITKAKALLAADADPTVNATIATLEETGRAVWRIDPWVDNVVGLLDPRTANTAWLVVYLNDNDWEVSEQFWVEADISN